MKRLRTAAGAVLVATGLAIGLTGCGASIAAATESQEQQAGYVAGTLSAQHVTLADGRTVTCIILDAGAAGGLSCDWANAE